MISPPTDSLYKFCAIVGLVMALWGAAFPWNKSYEAKLEGAKLRAEIKAAGEKAKQLQARRDALTHELYALASAPASELEKQEIRAKKRDLDIALIEATYPVDIGLERIKVIEEATTTYIRIGWTSLALGVFFTLLGFLAWYFRIQRYIDRDIKVGRDQREDKGS